MAHHIARRRFMVRLSAFMALCAGCAQINSTAKPFSEFDERRAYRVKHLELKDGSTPRDVIVAALGQPNYAEEDGVWAVYRWELKRPERFVHELFNDSLEERYRSGIVYSTLLLQFDSDGRLVRHTKARDTRQQGPPPDLQESLQSWRRKNLVGRRIARRVD